jgi:hypothetical protein
LKKGIQNRDTSHERQATNLLRKAQLFGEKAMEKGDYFLAILKY